MADQSATVEEGQAVVLPPHLWENFEKADAELREFYGVSPGALALMRLWLGGGRFGDRRFLYLWISTQ